MDAPADAHHVLTILAVADLPRAVDFYRRVLAWPLVVDTPVYAELARPGGPRLGLYVRDAFARNTGVSPTPAATDATTGTELYFHVTDVDAALARALEAGARLLAGPARKDWGDVAAYVADADANVLVLARPAAG